ncbi:MAG: hypothetical protein JWO05_2653 [Gemmatimonadetes bacterium]|nr:hypothetical protein [Gemmatimonadota bacterium]
MGPGTARLPSVAPSASPRPVGLRLIALLKLFQGSVLVIVGLGALRLLDPDMFQRFYLWMQRLSLGTDHRLVLMIVNGAMGLTPRRLSGIAVGAFGYALLLLVEGVGLWLAKRWAEYLTVVVTASFIPFELVALTYRVTAIRALMLVVNAVIVVYLLRELRRHSAVKKPGLSN